MINEKLVKIHFLCYNVCFILQKASTFQCNITGLVKKKIKNRVWFYVAFKLSLES